MRGIDHQQGDMFSYLSPEQRVRRITYDFFRTFDLSLVGGGWYKQEERDL